MTISLGDHVAKIVMHGVDTNPRSGIEYVWVTVRFDNGEEETARISLASDRGQKEDETTKRMARAALRLCGFDIDKTDIYDLNVADKLLFGNMVPINVSKSKDGQFTNFNIQKPRGITPARGRSLTESLRAMKSKDEEPIPAKPERAPLDTSKWSEEDKQAASTETTPGLNDIPF